ncbi:MFS transporter [Pediococcus acidilactici]
MNWRKSKIGIFAMVLVVILVGSMMRTPITTIPLILGNLAQSLRVAQGSLGILTTLPLVMFMVFSNFASQILKRMGFKRSLLLALAILVLGSALRMVVTMPTMIGGTILIGVAIAYLNVFMPSFVAAYFPQRIGLYTTLYTFSMMMGSAIFNLITAPIVKLSGWWTMLLILTVVPLLALLTWGLIVPHLPEEMDGRVPTPTDNKAPTKTVIWQNKRAWCFLLVFGCQSVMMYTFTAWMPSLMAYHHVGSGIIGAIMACFSLIGLPVSVFLPQTLTRVSRQIQVGLVLSAGVVGLGAAGMLFVQNTAATWFWLIEALLIGYSVNLFFVFVMTMFAMKTASPYQTAQLSGMSQAGGYLIAALGPVLYGMAFSANPVGSAQNVVYLAIVLVATVAGLAVVKMDQI